MGQHNIPTENILIFSRTGNHTQLRGALVGFGILEVLRKALKHAAKGGHAECVKLLIPHCDQGGLDRGLCEAAKYGHFDCVKILSAHANPFYDNSRALRKAAEFGCVEIVQHLIPISDQSSLSAAAVGAALMGQEACVDLFLPHMKGMVYPPFVFAAAQSGNSAILRKILHGAPGEYPVDGLILALSQENLECAHILIGMCDPREMKSRALAVAFKEEHWDVFDLLYPLSDPQQAHYWIEHTNQEAWRDAVARGQRLVLNAVVGQTHPCAVARKM